MKLLLFILGLALCTALPTYRTLQDNQIVDYSDHESGDHAPPRWLLEDAIDSAEEALPTQPEDGQNSEETLPGSDNEPENLLEEIKQDPELSVIFDFGGEAVIDSGIKKNKIPANKKFITTSISAYSTATTGNVERHMFSAEAVSEDERSVINMNFTVARNLKNNNMTLAGYSYIIKTTIAPVENSYVELTPSQIATGIEVAAALDYGVDQVLMRGVASGKIPQSNYTITNINSVFRMRQKTKNFYKFNVSLEDDKQVLIQAQFIVTVNPNTQDKFLMSFAYQISNIRFSIDESKYVKVNETEINNSTVINDCLDFAIEEVVKQSEEYSISKIKGVYTQTLKGIVYYKFDVELTNHKNKTIELVATVAYNPENEDKDVKAYEAKTITVTNKK